VVLGAAIYANSLGGKFIWDDEFLIEKNEYIKHPGGIAGFFTKPLSYGTPLKSNYYRPLQALTYALNYRAGGLDPVGYHVFNIILHVGAACALYWLTLLLFKNGFLSLATSLLFVAHPINTEAVTYISGRADPMVVVFMCLSVAYYVKAARGKKNLFYLLSAASYVLALFSKETALVIPFLLLAYDYICGGSGASGRAVFPKRAVPFFFIGVLYIILRKTALNFPAENTAINATLYTRVPLVLSSIAMYFKKLILPLDLHMEYRMVIPPMGGPAVMAGMGIFAALIAAAAFYAKREKIITFSIAWFLINYFPISNIYPLNAVFAEHWIYPASIGLYIASGWALFKIYSRGAAVKWLAVLLLAGLLFSASHATVRQNRHWAEPARFYERILKYNDKSSRVYNNLGRVYATGERAHEAIAMYEKAIEVKPDYLNAYNNLANAHSRLGNKAEAVTLYEKAVALGPNDADVYFNFGKLRRNMGEYEKAIALYKKAIEINPRHVKAHNNLGVAYLHAGKPGQAARVLEKAIEINPRHPEAYNNLAVAYFNLKRYSEAAKYYDAALRLGCRADRQFLEALHKKEKQNEKGE